MVPVGKSIIIIIIIIIIMMMIMIIIIIIIISDLEMLGIKDSTEIIQTAALLGTTHILRKTLSL